MDAQCVWVTAGASGIGREIVRRFAANGALVSVMDIAATNPAALAQDGEPHQRNPGQPQPVFPGGHPSNPADRCGDFDAVFRATFHGLPLWLASAHVVAAARAIQGIEHAGPPM